MEISPSELLIPPGSEYTISIALPDKGEVDNPELTVSVTGSNVTISGATTIKSSGFSDDDRTYSGDNTSVTYSADTVLVNDTVFVTVAVPDSASQGSTFVVETTYQGSTGFTSGFDLTESASYEVKETALTMDTMARQAEQRAKMADAYADAYDRLEQEQELFITSIERALVSGFTSVGVEVAQSFAAGPIGLVLDAKDAYDTLVGDGGAVGETFDLVDAITDQITEFPETVYSQDDTGASLRQLADNHRAEADAWRNADREALLSDPGILPSENEAICHPNGNSDNDTSIRENQRTQYPCVWGAAANELDYISNAPSLKSYYEAVQTFAYQDLLHVQSLVRPLAKRPDPSVDTNRGHSEIGSDLAGMTVGDRTTVEIQVSNAGNGGISDRGYLTVSHASSLEIVGVDKIAGDTDEPFNRVDVAVGEEINTKSGTGTADYPLTDISEAYDQGETNTYTVTFEQTGSGEVWFTYRSALKPALAVDSTDPNYARSPTSGQRDQQGWYAHRVEAQQPTQFDVGITGTNSPVVEGNTLSVDVAVNNTGDLSGTQTIVLDAGGLGTDSKSLSLGGGQSGSMTLSVSTGSGDAGSYQATVSSDDASSDFSVDVDAPGEFTIGISTNGSVVEGQSIEVSATVTNTGDKDETQTVEAGVETFGTKTRDVTLSSGETVSETFVFTTENDDQGTYGASVSCEDGSDSASIEVVDSGAFTVKIGTNSPVQAGRSIEVNGTITNTGSISETQTIEASVENFGMKSRSVSLSGGESTSETYTFETSGDDGGVYSATVSSGDDSDSTSVEVQEYNLDLSIATYDDSVPEGRELYVQPILKNTDSNSTNVDVELLDFSGTPVDNKNISLSGGEEVYLDMFWNTDNGDSGTGEVTVRTGEGVSVSRSVEITEVNLIEEAWSYQTQNEGDEYTLVHSSPTIVDGSVFVGSSNGYVYAFDSSNGTVEWMFDTGSSVRFAPIVTGDTVYVSNGSGLYVLDASNGTKRWDFHPSGDVGKPAVADGTVYINRLDESSDLYALAASDGSVRWRVTDRQVELPVLTVSNETIYWGHLALDSGDGSQTWSFENFDNPYYYPPTVADGSIYLATGMEGQRGRLYAIDAQDGTKRWSFQTDRYFTTAPTVSNNTVYLGCTDGSVYAVSTEDGAEQWTFQTSGRVRSSPTTADDTVYIGSDDRNLYGLDAQEGIERARFQVADEIHTSPTVVDGTVFFGVDDGNVYALNAEITGSSDDSLVKFGTLGHHHHWAERARSSSVSLTTSGDTIQAGEQATILLSAEAVDKIELEQLWADWAVSSTFNAGGSFSSRIFSDGTCQFTWSNLQTSVTPEIILSIPDRYVGGTYVLTATARSSGESTSETMTIDIQ